MFNLLSTIIIDNVDKVNLNWIGKIIRFICDKPAYGIGVGVILFTLILKLITMPFDIMSKVSTKKNALKMEKMRPELEKLQKQYANNKQVYQKKVMDLQKKEGYSPFSSCLPSILSIIIFFVVISAFNSYSTYANHNFANRMVNAYNAKVYSFNIGTLDANDNYLLDIDKIKAFDGSNFDSIKNVGEKVQSYSDYYLLQEKRYEVENGDTNLYNDLTTAGVRYSKVDNLEKIVDKYFEQKTKTVEEKEVIYYEVIDSIEDSLTASEVRDILQNFYLENVVPQNFYNEVIMVEAQVAAKIAFNAKRDSFLWIKNIWVADSTFKHPLEGASAYGMSSEDYTILTGEMSAEKSAKNGYFILVVLSIAIMFLSQLVMEKDQKTQMELQTVDGANSTAGQTQKMMKWIMPIMFGIFAFIYTASFSIYMIISSAFSIISSLVINAIVKKVFEKKALQAELDRDKRFKIKK